MLLDSNLVIEITGARGGKGTAVQVWTKKPVTTAISQGRRESTVVARARNAGGPNRPLRSFADPSLHDAVAFGHFRRCCCLESLC
jgi:hypothetical protein